jgi:PHD/YefM family antitoxin component YafN of YafNO toxin-antitoxin module
MSRVEHSQSLAEFRQSATQTLDRINRTGEPEILTVDGEARAVLLSPAAYHELSEESALARDVAVIQQSLQEIEQGKARPAGEVFAELRAKLESRRAS